MLSLSVPLVVARRTHMSAVVARAHIVAVGGSRKRHVLVFAEAHPLALMRPRGMGCGESSYGSATLPLPAADAGLRNMVQAIIATAVNSSRAIQRPRRDDGFLRWECCLERFIAAKIQFFRLTAIVADGKKQKSRTEYPPFSPARSYLTICCSSYSIAATKRSLLCRSYT